MDLVLSLIRDFSMKKTNRSLKRGRRRSPRPATDEEDLFNHIVISGKGIIYDEEDELQENDSEFLQSGTVQYQTREDLPKNKAFFE
ncbi:hypothetical protein OSB04_un001456 [Centaurea solstitialis]|uniref:Uncharacterized protein n=1 Tax=Centaurea solstitialis TaxID=347529 RepID=A0AA38W1P7_9ASTR|nr:hypothetical protein OSB04_un001456 [Centaurea solstitialis]